MADEPADRPGQWRKRATELRAMADTFKYGGTREDLLVLAEQWDCMAEREALRLLAQRGEL